MLLRLLFIFVLGFATSVKAVAAAEYFFCVSSNSFETFRAHVVFRSIDFGETAARQMVFNDVKRHLGDDVVITRYVKSTCGCGSTCAQLEVAAKDWDGNLGENNASTSTLIGATAEVLDKFFYESKQIFTDPGTYLKKKLFGTE